MSDGRPKFAIKDNKRKDTRYDLVFEEEDNSKVSSSSKKQKKKKKHKKRHSSSNDSDNEKQRKKHKKHVSYILNHIFFWIVAKPSFKWHDDISMYVY